jgi:RNA polymerase sigma factor (sigma-70 family)
MNTEFADLRKILERQSSGYKLEGFIPIAFGEAVTKLYEEEAKAGKEFTTKERRKKIYWSSRHKILDELRRQGKIEHYDTNVAAFESIYSDDDFEKREEDKLLTEEMLAKLRQKQREAMELFIKGYSVEEIAVELRVSPNTIKKRLKEAKKELRRFFGNEGNI